MDELIETDKFYLSDPFFVQKSPSPELKITSEDAEDIKQENNDAFPAPTIKAEPKTSSGTDPSVIIDPLKDSKGRSDLTILICINYFRIQMQPMLSSISTQKQSHSSSGWFSNWDFTKFSLKKMYIQLW